MSTTVDQRVVEMRFDNQNFEKNVSTTMSTLEKLKQKLNLTGASKSLEEVNAAAKKVDMTGLARGVETVTTKFSALQVMGTTALVNITNQAVNAGKRIVSSLTVAPVGDGFKEYEMTLNAVQTTMSATGKTAEEVEAQLKKLDEYADKTVYGTADMLNNLPKFTNAGVDLEKATTAMIGIANATALAGGDASKASIAFYNLGQAIGTGYLTRMDYNSINNAGIATMEWKEAMVEAAIAQGTLTKAGENSYKAGNKTLTLQQLFIDGLQEQWATTEVLMKVFGDYGDETTEVGKKAYSAAQDIKTYTMMMESLKATAGTGWKDTWQILFGGLDEAKKFWTTLNNVISDVITRMADFRNGVLKTALGSKWDKLVAKIEAAGYTTEQFTGMLTDVLEESGISVDELKEKYGSLSDAIAAGAVPVTAITKALKRLLGIEDDATNATKKVTMSMEELDKVAKRVIRGEFSNGQERIRKLTEAGYDYATVQNRVNEILGSSVRHTSKLTEEQLANADSLAKMSDEQLKANGYTDEQIEALRELQKAAEGADSSITDLIDDLGKPSGRTLLLESFANIWEKIKEFAGYIGEAWVNIFGDKDVDDYADGIYGIIEKFHDLTETMSISEDTANNFRTVMEGLFAGFQLGTTIMSKSVIASIKILDAVLGLFGTDLLGVAAKISEYIIAFNEWIKTNTMFGYGTWYGKIATVLKAIYDGVSKCVEAFLGLDKVQEIITKFKRVVSSLFEDMSDPIDLFSLDGILTVIEGFFAKLESWIKGIDFADDLGLYIIEGLRSAFNIAFDGIISWINGLTIFEELGINMIRGIPEGMVKAVKWIFNTVLDIATTIYDSFCSFFQVKSPSRLMMTLGGFIISGLVLGIIQGFGDVSGALQSLLDKCTGNLDWSKFSAVFWNISALLPSAPIFNAIAAMGNTFAVFGQESGGDIISGLVKGISGGVQKVISAIVEIASNLISSFKDKIDSHSPSRVFMTIGGFIIAGLLLGLKEGIITLPGALQDIIDKCLAVINSVDWSGVFAVGISVGALLLVKKFADILEAFSKPFGKLGDLFGSLKKVVDSFGDVTKAMVFNLKMKAIKQLAIALAILVGSVVAITLLVDDPKMLWHAVGVVAALTVILGVLAWTMNQLGDASLKFENGKFSFNGLKQNLLAISLAILMVGGIVAILGRMEPEALEQGLDGMLKVMVSMLAFVGMLQLLGKIKGADNIDKIGSMAFKLAIAMGLMTLVVKMVGKLRPSELTKGIIFMGAFGLFIRALAIAIPTGSSSLSIGKGGLSKTSSGKLGSTILGVTAAMLLMVGLCKVVDKLEAREMIKGAGFATAFIFFVKYLVKATTVSDNTKMAKLGGLVLSVSVAMLMLVGMCELVGKLTPKEMAKGVIFAAAFIGFVKGIVKVTTITNDVQMAKVAGTLVGLSIAVGVLAGICVMMSILDWEQLAKGSLAVGLLATFMAGMIYAARGVQDIKGTMVMLVVGIGMLAAIMAALMLVKDPKKLIAPVAALGTLLVTFGYAIKAMSSITPQKGLVKTLGIMLGVVVALGGVVWALSHLVKNPEAALAASVSLAALLLAFSKSINILSNSNQKSTKAYKQILSMLGVALALGILLSFMSHFSKAEALVPSSVALGILLNTFSTSLWILSKSEKNTTKAYGAILEMTGAALALGILLSFMSHCSKAEALIPSAVALGILLNTFSTSMWILSKSEKNTTKAYDQILNMVGVALASAILLSFMSKFANAESLIPSAVALGILLNTFSTSMLILSKSSPNFTASMKTIWSMAAISVILGAVLVGMSKWGNPKALIPSAAAAGILLNTFATSLLILSAIKAPITISQKALWSMVGVTAVMALVVWGLSKITNTEAAMANAITLSGLMTVLTVLMAGVSAVGKFLKTGMVSGILGLSAMVIPLALFVAALHFMPDLGNAKEKITSLVPLMTAMTILLPIVSVIGKFLKGGMVAGILGLTAMVIPMFAFAWAVSKMPVINEGTITSIKALTQVMIVLLAAVSAIGMFLAAGVVPGVIALCGFMAAMGIFVVFVGQLMEKFPQIQTWVDKGIPMLVQLADGIGDMIGAFIQAIGTAIGNTLVQLGADIATFMAHLATAADNASAIEAGSFDGVYDLMKALGGIAGVAAGTQLADWFVFGGTSMDKFKNDALAFFAAMTEIAPKMAECKMPENFSVDGVISLLDAMKKIGGYVVGSQIAEWFYFGDDQTVLEKFKNDAINFFKAMKALPEHMTGFSFPEDFNIEGLETLLSVLKRTAWAMAGVSIADLFAQLAGDEGTIEKFKTDAVAFFKAIKAIAPEMTGFSFPKDFDMDGFDNFLTVLKRTAGAMVGVSIGDLFSQMVGDGGTIEKFESDGKAFFKAITAISGEMVGFAFPENFSVEGLDKLLGVFKTISKSMRGTSWSELFTLGEGNSVDQFQTYGTGLFAAIKAISNEASGVTTTSFDTATTAVDKIKAIIESVKGIDYSGVADFTGIGIGQGGRGADGPMHDIALAIKDFSDQLADVNVDNLTTAITAVGDIKTFINELASLDVSGIETYKEAIESLGGISLSKFAESFNAELPKVSRLCSDLIKTLAKGIDTGKASIAASGTKLISDMVSNISSKADTFRTAGSAIMIQFVNGITKTGIQVSKAITSTLNSAKSSIRGYYKDFYDAGSYLVDGFTAGISGNMYKAAAKAAAMANAAKDAAEAALGINSPSKVFYSIGEFTGQGFINALTDYGSKVYDAGSEMAGSAKSGLSDAIGKVLDVINGNVELQPTIRPVVDLSDVQAGAGAISGLLGFGTSVGVAANLGAISGMMNTNQNGSNGDIVSAIEKLRKDISNLGGTSYTINGMTYSNDADLDAAFETIARAALVGRRV